jgi:hypothetical protein
MCQKVVGAVSVSASETHESDGVSVELNGEETWISRPYGRID